jgi:hypothetical protein
MPAWSRLQGGPLGIRQAHGAIRWMLEQSPCCSAPAQRCRMLLGPRRYIIIDVRAPCSSWTVLTAKDTLAPPQRFPSPEDSACETLPLIDDLGDVSGRWRRRRNDGEHVGVANECRNGRNDCGFLLPCEAPRHRRPRVGESRGRVPVIPQERAAASSPQLSSRRSERSERVSGSTMCARVSLSPCKPLYRDRRNDFEWRIFRVVRKQPG